MVVNVQHFAVLREVRGICEETVDIECAEAITIENLFERLFPEQKWRVFPVMFAVNDHYVTKDHHLADGDTVVFIPPLGGG